jgi:lipopolysaccharide transport system permease protein
MLKLRWLSDAWHYRELLYFLAWREVKIRYKQAALGAAWAVLQPLMGMLVFTVVFGRIAGMSTRDVPYPVFVYCALVPWTYFSTVLAQASNSLVGNSNLITKVYFPRMLLPASTAAAGLLDFAISSTVLVVLMAYYHVRPGWQLLLLPFFVVAMIVLTLGVSLLFGAMNVRYRDVKYVIPFMLQLWLFCTPIIYPATIATGWWSALLRLNPCVAMVEGFRAAVFSQPLNGWSVAPSLIISLALFVIGLVYFRKTERTFADIV